MRITDLLDARSVSLTSSPKTKSEALDQAVALMTKSGKINDEEAYRSQVYAREEESTTGIGEGIAIPHGKSPDVKKVCVAIGQVDNGVEWNDINNSIVSFIILFAVPESENSKVEMKLMSDICIKLADDCICEKLIYSKRKEDIVEILS